MVVYRVDVSITASLKEVDDAEQNCARFQADISAAERNRFTAESQNLWRDIFMAQGVNLVYNGHFVYA
jgi:hypothetical protein